MPHYSSFLPLVPSEIKLDHEGLELYRESLYQIADQKDHIVRRVQESWRTRLGRCHSYRRAYGSFEPGTFQRSESSLSVPFTTALHACVAALSVYSAKRVLLLTPFDEKLND